MGAKIRQDNVIEVRKLNASETWSMENSEVTVVMEAPVREGEDCTPHLQRALEQCRLHEGPVRLRLPAGTLHFWPDFAPERFVRVTNNDSGMRRIAFLLEGLHGLQIQGSPTALVFHGEIIPFEVTRCAGLTVSNISIDWFRPFHFEGEVIAAGEGFFEVKPRAECLWEIRDGRLCWVERPLAETSQALWYSKFRQMLDDFRWERQLGWNIWIDPQAKAIARESQACLFNGYNAEKAESYRAVRTDTGTVRIEQAGFRTPPKLGWIFVDKGATDNRQFPAFHLQECQDVLFEHVTIHHADGMGVIAEFCENISLVEVVVTPSGSRAIATTADATHFMYCRGLIRLERCRFEQMPDDGINVHGNYFRIEGRDDRGGVWLAPRHPQHEFVDFAFSGDHLAVADAETFHLSSEHQCTSVERCNGTLLRLQCDPPLPAGCEGQMLENLSWQANLEMRDCVVRGNRARAALFATRGKAIIERNHFEDQSMGAVLVEIDANLWHETGPVGTLVVRDNTILGPAREFIHNPAIQITPNAGREGLEPIHDQITITGNRITVDHGRVLVASGVRQLNFTGNEITFRVPVKAGVEPIVIKHCASADVDPVGV